jgi:hypothetical protein
MPAFGLRRLRSAHVPLGEAHRGFIKKTQRTPAEDLRLARGNKSKHERGLP